MIKCNVTVIGKVFRPVELKEDRNGNPFVTFGVSVLLKDNQESKNIDISVASNGDDNTVLALKPGDRVRIEGVLSFKSRGDLFFFNLSADKTSRAGSDTDSVSGTLLFRGTLGSKDILERQGKKGGLKTFDAYSSERINENEYAYTWVHFVLYEEKSPDWLLPKAKIEAEGDLQLQLYNDRVSINCRIKSIGQWDKNKNN